MEVQGKAFNSQIFKLNPDAKYHIPNRWDKITSPPIDFTKLQIFVNENDSFQARNLNVFTDYVLTFFDAATISRWLSKCDMSFYQNQLNFAVWCASSGCGVSYEHLNAEKKLLSAVFRFHMYYQTRKFLHDLSCPIPGDKIFKSTENNINMLRYQKLCNEFNIATGTDFRFKGGENGGIGTMYNYWTNMGYHAVTEGQLYDPNKFKFIENCVDNITKIDYIKQDAASEGWKQFIPDKSEGLTKAGLVRLDDSIRSYAYCILGAQAQTRSSILTSLETQQNFVDLLEASIRSLFSIPDSIEQYQNAISRTNSKIDYTIGTGLYMIPSTMVLNVGSVKAYNNNIATESDAKHSKLQVIQSHSTDAGLSQNEAMQPMYMAFGVSVLTLILFYVFS